jgi:predicted ribosome quality control (RQC) complex YloA/Tae2 family protein
MLSLAEIRRAAALVDAELSGARVERIVEPDPLRVVLSFGRQDAHLLLCADPSSARLSRIDARPAAPPSPAAFAQLLRARIGGARLASARIVGGDRQAALRFEGPEGRAHELLLAVLGPRTNLWLLDAESRVVGALRPLAETRRDLALGAPWRSPSSRPPPEGEDRFAGEHDARFFAALEALAAEREGRRRREELGQRLEKALRRGEQSLAKKLEALRLDAASGDEAARLRRQGELLKGALSHVRPGAREARARDFETGEEVAIPLDPALSPKANLDELFRRARKAEKRAERGVRELGEAEARSEAIAALRGELDAIADAAEPALAAFAARPEVARLLARFAPEAGAPVGPAPAAGPRTWRVGSRELPARLHPRVYRSSDGLEIWVGRSDEGNDLLSTRLARGTDLFFHLDASPGSHVVLRTEGKSDPPSETLLEACELAVHFSKHRRTTQADVLVAPIKNVRKPRGAKPGLVWVTGGKTVRLRRDAKRLERVLGSRGEGDGD